MSGLNKTGKLYAKWGDDSWMPRRVPFAIRKRDSWSVPCPQRMYVTKEAAEMKKKIQLFFAGLAVMLLPNLSCAAEITLDEQFVIGGDLETVLK
ncbi:hypothetical protein ACLB1Q_36500 [Escherichia coli]